MSSLLELTHQFVLADRKRAFNVFLAIFATVSIAPNPFGSRRPSGAKQRTTGPRKARVDGVFFKQLMTMLKICFPNPVCLEAQLCYLLSVLLIARTWLSVYIANIAGRNAQHLVALRWPQLFAGIRDFSLITLPAAMVNAGLKWSTAMLSLRIRYRLANAVNSVYLSGTNFYKATQFPNIKIESADQRVTSDITKFSEEIAELYSSVSKPLLDVFLFTVNLAHSLGWQAPTLMYMYFVFSSAVKKRIMPAFGRMVANESRLEGLYRTAHQRVIVNAEEIAFYDGALREGTIIDTSLRNIYNAISHASNLRYAVKVCDDLLVKYWASISGYFVLTIPYILDLPHYRGKSTDEFTREYILNTQYLTNMSQAVGNLVLTGNKLTSIAGYTQRVSELLELVNKLDSIGNDPFTVREEVDETGIAGNQTAFSSTVREMSAFLEEWRNRADTMAPLRRQVRQRSRTAHDEARRRRLGFTAKPAATADTAGRFLLSDSIKFEAVDLVNPDGAVLARNLNFEVCPGRNVMVTGPNGCGKSSLFRLLGELWPLSCGTVSKPHKDDILFVPQKPYLVMGTLRDQVIYPHTAAEAKELGVSDEDLAKLVTLVDPAQKILRTWSWEDEKDWFAAFSGGQKQRIAMARVFYHRPKYAILDECTSAVSADVEDAIYTTCAALGITIFTVSHRSALRRHHDSVLAFDGYGGWDFYDVADSEKAELRRTTQNVQTKSKKQK